MQKRNLGIIAVVASIAFLGSIGGASAAAQITSEDIKNQDIRSVDMAEDSVGKSEIATNSVGRDEVQYNSLHGWNVENDSLTNHDIQDGTIGLDDISRAAEDALAGQDGTDGVDGTDGADGEQGPAGEPGADGVVAPVSAAFTANVAKVGGPFSSNATEAGTVDLSAGKYIVSTDGLFRSNQATSGNADLQVAVRAADGSEWGADLGTAFTGDSPAQAQREVSTHTTRVVELAEDTTVTVHVFGYDGSGEGSADSGKFDAEVYLTAVPVQD